MNFTEPTEDQPDSPLPHEPDIGLCVLISIPSAHELRFVACMSAALRLAMHWVAEYPAMTVTFESPDRQSPRLPCERLWTLP